MIGKAIWAKYEKTDQYQADYFELLAFIKKNHLSPPKILFIIFGCLSYQLTAKTTLYRGYLYIKPQYIEIVSN